MFRNTALLYMILPSAICRVRSAACSARFALMTQIVPEGEAAVDPYLAGTADLDLSKCYVCQTSKDGERLTQCLSAKAYLKMQEVGPAKRVYSDVAQAFDEMEVNVLFQSSEQGKFERRRLAEGCCNNMFHQTCLKRRREASHDNRWTTTRHVEGGQGEKEHVQKDILHHCCAKCVMTCTGSEETRYTDHLDGKPLQMSLRLIVSCGCTN